MGRYVEQFHEGLPHGLGNKKSRRGGTYHAYIPDKMSEIDFVPSEKTSFLLSKSHDDFSRLTTLIGARSELDLSKVLLFSEGIASSRIEEIVGTTHNIVLAFNGSRKLTDVSRLIINNVEQTRRSFELFSVEGFSVDEIEILQKSLLRNPSYGEHWNAIMLGYRGEQNIIGGTSPIDAIYVPPIPELVPELVEDLVSYLNHSTHDAITKIALSHAQFESIHPFIDGNGRTGRSLIQGVISHEGLFHTVLPISRVLISRGSDYFGVLNEIRNDGKPDNDKMNLLVQFFCIVVSDAVYLVEEVISCIEELHRSVDEMFGSGSEVVKFILNGLSASLTDVIKEFGYESLDVVRKAVEIGFLESRRNNGEDSYFSPELISVIDGVPFKTSSFTDRVFCDVTN